MSIGIISIDQSKKRAISIINSDLNLGVESYTILCNALSNNITVTLPTASVYKGKLYNIKTINLTNRVLVDTIDSALIDSSTSHSFSTVLECVRLQCNGTNWFKI